MGKVIYITGGAGSGKSEFAERLLSDSKKKIYIATSVIFDDEIREKVSEHQKRRDGEWILIERYKDIVLELEKYKRQGFKILLECLTNLVSNYMLFESSFDWEKKVSKTELKSLESTIIYQIEGLIQFVRENGFELVIVSNEIGMGLVPTYPLGRYFRDISGKINQYIASRADEAYLIVSGLDLRLK